MTTIRRIGRTPFPGERCVTVDSRSAIGARPKVRWAPDRSASPQPVTTGQTLRGFVPLAKSSKAPRIRVEKVPFPVVPLGETLWMTEISAEAAATGPPATKLVHPYETNHHAVNPPAATSRAANHRVIRGHVSTHRLQPLATAPRREPNRAASDLRTPRRRHRLSVSSPFAQQNLHLVQSHRRFASRRLKRSPRSLASSGIAEPVLVLR